jgi:two-component system OmpR family sensor kinase
VSTATSSRGNRLSRVPLRVTLVALLLVLVAVALSATGIAAASLLQRYLGQQQDAELRNTLRDFSNDRGILTACWTRTEQERFTGPGNYFACLAPGSDEPLVLAGPPSDDELPDLDAAALDALVDRGPGPRGPNDAPVTTVASADRDQAWRVTAARLPGGLVLVVGGDVDRDDRVIGRLVAIEVVVGLAVLALLGLAGYWLVRNSLRPLAAVERTAQAAASGRRPVAARARRGRPHRGRPAVAGPQRHAGPHRELLPLPAGL